MEYFFYNQPVVIASFLPLHKELDLIKYGAGPSIESANSLCASIKDKEGICGVKFGIG